MVFGFLFLFFGIIVWYIVIRVRNFRIIGVVICGEYYKVIKFIVFRRGILYVLVGIIYFECKKSEFIWFFFKFFISDGLLKLCILFFLYLEKIKYIFKYRVLNIIWIFYILNWNIVKILLYEFVKLLKYFNLIF